jgi:hypothetical protein
MRRSPLLVALALALPLGTAGCFSWDPATRKDTLPDPGTLAPSQAIRLAPGQDVPGEIACETGFCQQWYRIDVPQPGVLRVDVAIGVADPPLARAVLHDGQGNVLARANTESGTTLRVEAAVDAGPAALLVQSGKGRLPYTVSVSLE